MLSVLLSSAFSSFLHCALQVGFGRHEFLVACPHYVVLIALKRVIDLLRSSGFYCLFSDFFVYDSLYMRC